MKKFKYRAETYLRFISHQRDQALFNFKEAEHQVLQVKEAISGIEEAMKNAFKKNSQLGQDDTSIHFVNDNNQFIQFLKQRNKDLQGELVNAEEIYREKYELLMELQTKLKSVEKHKQNKQDEFNKDYRKSEQKKLDEMNTIRYGGKGAGSSS